MAAVSTNMIVPRGRTRSGRHGAHGRPGSARRGLLWLLGALVLACQMRTGAQAPAAPRRIVSFVPAATEMLFAMGAGARLVGVSSYDRFPAEVSVIPRVGGLLDPNVEQVLALRPDLVVVYGTQAELRQQLRRAGLDVFVYTHRDLSDVTATMRALGMRVGVEVAAAAAAADLTRRLDAVRARVAGRPRPRTLLVFGRERGSLRQIRASGGYGFLHDLLELAGGEDVWRDVRRESVEMSTEMVLARAPDVIIELHYGRSLSADQLAAEALVWNGLPAVPAVRHKRVHLLLGDEFVVPGPRLATAAEQLSRAVHPDAY
jgi:iron complex transport system substrate-binding protein